ncbi:hypothetical protein [Dendronalium sp. ChiSLP03b]
MLATQECHPKGLGVSQSGGASRVGGSPDLSGLASTAVETQRRGTDN